MAGVRDRGPRRRSDYYAEQPDRVNASQHAALGGRSREPVSILGSIRPCRLDGRCPCGRRPASFHQGMAESRATEGTNTITQTCPKAHGITSL